MNWPWKKHLSEGQLRAAIDSQLGQVETARLQAHLETCPQCRLRWEEIRTRSARVSSHLHQIQPSAGEIAPTRAARARLDQTIRQKESYPMFQKLFSRRFRGAWATAGIIAVLALLLTVPQVRAIAVDFLGLFRVEKVEVVPVTLDNLPHQLGESTSLQNLFADSIQFEGGGDSVDVENVDSLSQLAGFPVRLPQLRQLQPAFQYQPGGTVTLTIDVDQFQAILQEIGRSDIQIPQSLDGEEVVVTISGAAIAQYGTCRDEVEAAQEGDMDPDDDSAPWTPLCTTFMQMPSPTVETQPGLDIDMIGTAYLELIGLSPDQAAEFSQNVDWATTLVIPLPTQQADYTSVTVDGVQATLVTSKPGQSSQQYALIWVKEGMLYFLTGPGDSETALNLAGSIE